MGTVLASKIAADAAEALFDPDYTRFSLDDHLKWINAGQNEAAILKPDISVNNTVVQLAEGTKQTIPDSELSFIKLVRNMGTDGSTPGMAIRVVDMDHFNRHNPNWHTATASATVEVFMFDERDPKHFYVYPPQPSSVRGYVEKVSAILPTAISTIDDPINIDDIYENVLLDYDLYRALAVDAKQSPYARAGSIRHWNQFVAALGRKELVEKINSPTRKEEKR